MIWPSTMPLSSRARGVTVVLPAPVGACSTTVFCDASVSRNLGKMAWMGKGCSFQGRLGASCFDFLPLPVAGSGFQSMSALRVGASGSSSSATAAFAGATAVAVASSATAGGSGGGSWAGRPPEHRTARTCCPAGRDRPHNPPAPSPLPLELPNEAAATAARGNSRREARRTTKPAAKAPPMTWASPKPRTKPDIRDEPRREPCCAPGADEEVALCLPHATADAAAACATPD
mmetsp:Transcript_159352/g.511237  ORF Transcript_159352/g.511237 Transcript_159352/m.511237 type:complete len:232 (+) Transcript_159352:3682-4377(+)